MLVMALATMTAQAQDDAEQVASAPAETITLDLSRGTYQLGGSATANIALLPATTESQTDVYLLLSPQGGYFIVDRVELFVGVDLLVDETGLEVGVFAGFDY
ncbi:MAG: hypothetical protein KTR31_22220, partial [Myxococcales bacterium]|nr:hypothetical protein [Myxococcales bacterium]